MKKLSALALALILALSPAALAFNPERFQNTPGVVVQYDPSVPTAYTVKAGFVTAATSAEWTEFGGHVVVRYSNAGKSTEIPMILVGFTTAADRAVSMTVRTDAHLYEVVCTDLGLVGLTGIASEGTVMITETSAAMLRDMAASSYVRITLRDGESAGGYTFMMKDSARSLLNLFLDEYAEQIAPMVAADATLTAVYERLSPAVTTAEAVYIADKVGEITAERYNTLKNGSQGDEVVRLQEALIAMGLLTGSADGHYGKRTVAAVKAYQESVGLENDGVAGAETQMSLFITALDYMDAGPDAAADEPAATADAPAVTMEMPAATAEPTAAPTAEPTAEPTAAPTAEPTAVPTAAPTAEPTAVPTAEPTAAPAAPIDSLSQYVTLQSGDQGEDVARLQEALILLGFPNNDPRGVYGWDTVACIHGFQYAVQFEETGVADPATQMRLFAIAEEFAR